MGADAGAVAAVGTIFSSTANIVMLMHSERSITAALRHDLITNFVAILR